MAPSSREAVIDLCERAERLLDWIYSSGSGEYVLRRCGVVDPDIADVMDLEYERNVQAAKLLERRRDVEVSEGPAVTIVALRAPVVRTR